MAIGEVVLQLGLVDKKFKNGLVNAEKSLSNSVDKMKNLVIGAGIGRLLFAGASQQATEELKMVQTQLSALNQGLSQESINAMNPIIQQLDYLGIGADQASDALYKFVLTGKSMGLQPLGIYLDQTTQSMLTAMDATERMEWALANLPDQIQKIQDQLTPTTAKFYEFQKKADDVKKALGTSFMQMVSGVVDSMGGMVNTMKIVIGAFVAYRTAMIIGNVAIGISKAIASGSVFAAPIAIGMGVASLAAISALIGGSIVATSALSNVEAPNSTKTTNTTTPEKESTIIVYKDKFSSTQKVVSQNSGGLSNSVQTNYGSNSQ